MTPTDTFGTANLGDRIRAARELNDLTQMELADHIGLSRSQISNLEANRGDPSLSALLGISNATGVPVAALIGQAPMPELPRVRVVTTYLIDCTACGEVETTDSYPVALKQANAHRRGHLRGRPLERHDHQG